MKIISFNVNGIRASVKKGLAKSIEQMQPDVICFQETKASVDQVREALKELQGFHLFANSAERPGYSGTAILSKENPLSVHYGIGITDHDKEGRNITAEYDDFFLVTTYVPNSGQELLRLDYRQQWNKDMHAYLKNLEKKKPVIWCGDFNVAHKPIDLANPKPNYNKTAGYTQKEIDGMDTVHSSGFVDTFRKKFPEVVKYSWWSARFNSRAKNVGWRIDYFMVSESLYPKVKDAFILNEIEGSDHCPVGIII
ncbi:MAG: exodeoxyribonuclease III [Flavobacteriales bacterium]|nr:exodeoxyribonuclease III [Flavobacteriales bacterium]